MERSQSSTDIIRHLEGKPALWRKEDVNFGNRDLRRRLLGEISKATGLTVGMCTTRIKSLKDRMRICVSKLPKTEDGTPDFSDTSSITWPYFKRLLFMKDQFTGRPMTDNFQSQLDQVGMADDSALLEADDEVNDDLQSNRSNSPDPIPEHKPILVPAVKKRSRDETQKELLDLERQKLDHLFSMVSDSESVKIKDDLYYFVLDIANDLRSIQDPMVKIQTKSKIRRVVEEAVVQDLRNRPVTSVPEGKPYYVVYNNGD